MPVVPRAQYSTQTRDRTGAIDAGFNRPTRALLARPVPQPTEFRLMVSHTLQSTALVCEPKDADSSAVLASQRTSAGLVPSVPFRLDRGDHRDDPVSDL